MKKIIALFIALLFMFNFAMAINDIGVKERELKEISDELKKVDSKIKLNKSDQYEVIDKINAIESDIKKLDTELYSLNVNIINTKDSITNAEMELADKNSKLENMKEILSKRLRVMYKTGKGSIDEINSIKEKLETDKIELINLKTKVELNKNYLKENEKKLETKKNELKSNAKLLEAMEDKLEEDANKVTEIIKSLKTKAQYVGGQMGWPVPNHYKITSPFGYRIHPVYHTRKLHTGIDISASSGTTVVAAQTGTVIYANWLGGYGKVVMIDHGGGYVTLAAHLSKINVKVGQNVQRGDAVAKSGNTGVSTGPHVHFEVRINGDYVDPLKYLKN